jgi:hypothetical protein
MATTKRAPTPAARKPRVAAKTPVSAPRQARPPATPPEQVVARRQPRSSEPEPFLRFYLSDDLRARTLTVVAAIERSPEPTTHREALGEVVVALTNAGMDYFLMQPLRVADAGFVTVQAASLGMSGVEQVMGSVIRNVIAYMDGRALISVCGSIRRFMS